jgi:hypothetical protein
MENSGYSRKYKLKSEDSTSGTMVVRLYSMLPPVSGELTPSGYSVVFQNTTQLAQASKVYYMSQLDLFLGACGLNSTTIETFKSTAEIQDTRCGMGAFINSFQKVDDVNDNTFAAIDWQVNLKTPAPSGGMVVYGYVTRVDGTTYTQNISFAQGETSKSTTGHRLSKGASNEVSYTIIQHESYFIATDNFGGKCTVPMSLTVYTATRSFTATCDSGYTGSYTSEKTETSTVSQTDANNKASAAAQSDAQANLVCQPAQTYALAGNMSYGYMNDSQSACAVSPSDGGMNPVYSISGFISQGETIYWDSAGTSILGSAFYRVYNGNVVEISNGVVVNDAIVCFSSGGEASI